METQRVDRDLLERGRALPPPPPTKPAQGGSPPRVPARFLDATFETFDLSRNPKMRPALDAARAARSLLFLYGPPGLGKTHLACAAMQGRRAMFWEVPEFLAWLRSFYGREQGGDQVEQIVETYKSADFLLVLDDLGAHNQTAWAEEQLYRILNGRYNNEAPTLITANVDIGRIDERIRSRFRSGMVICEGSDLR